MIAILRSMDARPSQRFKSTPVGTGFALSLLGPTDMFRSLAVLLIATLLVLTSAGLVVSTQWKAYFPIGSLERSPESDHFKNRWYSDQLAAMEEPVILPMKDVVVYRFTWLRSFHRPVAVRVTSDHGRASFSAVELSGAGGYDPGHVSRRTAGRLTEQQFETIRALMDAKGFWTMSSYEESLGRDGSEWIVEGSREGRYRVVTRWTPAAGPIREIGERFLALPGWSFPAEEVY